MIARLLAFLLLLLAPFPALAQTIVVHAGRLITDASRPAQGPSTITIVDGRIQSVTAGLVAAPDGARLIDLSTRRVTADDMHVTWPATLGEFWREAVDSEEYQAMGGVKTPDTARAGFTPSRLGSRPCGFALARGRENLLPGLGSCLGPGHFDPRRPCASRLPPEVLAALGAGNTAPRRQAPSGSANVARGAQVTSSAHRRRLSSRARPRAH